MVERIRNEIKRLESENISVLDLQIVYEIDCQLENEISKEDYMKIYYNSRNAYLKTDECSLSDIVRYCIKNVDKIDDMSSWEIVENSYVIF